MINKDYLKSEKSQANRCQPSNVFILLTLFLVFLAHNLYGLLYTDICWYYIDWFTFLIVSLLYCKWWQEWTLFLLYSGRVICLKEKVWGVCLYQITKYGLVKLIDYLQTDQLNSLVFLKRFFYHQSPLRLLPRYLYNS